jgi:hypothetical protein
MARGVDVGWMKNPSILWSTRSLTLDADVSHREANAWLPTQAHVQRQIHAHARQDGDEHGLALPASGKVDAAAPAAVRIQEARIPARW